MGAGKPAACGASRNERAQGSPRRRATATGHPPTRLWPGPANGIPASLALLAAEARARPSFSAPRAGLPGARPSPPTRVATVLPLREPASVTLPLLPGYPLCPQE